ncbi:hypothetical protein QL285_014077 [Trifolium repens]|nr:hypothetical protein QL285_014077 [Trifolium repens]
MENWQEQHNDLKGEVAQLAAKMDQVLEMLANRNQPSPPVVNEETVTTEPANVVWPTFGLPPGYTPPGYVPLADGVPFVPPPVNSTENQTGATLVQPRLVPSQGIQEDPKEAYLGPEIQSGEPKLDFAIPQLEEAKMKFKAIEDRLKTMEGVNDSLDFSSMCLVPDLVLPPKFKVPEFEKYMGLSCPKSHLIMYSRKMASYANDDKLMIHCFQDSLAGASLNWYMQLEGSRIRSWRDLANAFIKQYQYNLDMAPSRTQLQNMTQKEGESFKVYAQRWRELAAQVRPPLLESELVDIFTNTLQGVYFERMVGSVSSGFSDLVKIGERIENGIKNGKIQATNANQNSAKKSASSFPEKKEEEANYVTSKKGSTIPTQIPYCQYPYVAATSQGKYPQPLSIAPLQGQQQQHNGYPPKNQHGPRKERRNVHYDHIPMPYGQILPYLLQKGLVQLKPLDPVSPPYPPGFDENARCDYHNGSPGHNIENCRGFKYKVQELIDQKLLTFKEGEPNREG